MELKDVLNYSNPKIFEKNENKTFLIHQRFILVLFSFFQVLNKIRVDLIINMFYFHFHAYEACSI